MTEPTLPRRQHDGAGAARARPAPALGVIEWYRPGERERVERLVEGLRRIGVGELGAGVSWADWQTPEGRAWYDWLLPRLARDLCVLPCFAHTPPSPAVAPRPPAPPRDPEAYADFLDDALAAHGAHFEWVGLWNGSDDPNERGRRPDPDRHGFAATVGGAAHRARRRGKRTVLGGVCPADSHRLALLCRHGALDHVDAVGLHAFPATWRHDWPGWPGLVAEVRGALRGHGHEPELWIAGVGHPTRRADEAGQIACLLEALAAPVERVYWYAYQDLDPAAAGREGFHADERRHHLGLVRADGQPKLLHRLLAKGGVELARRVHAIGRGIRPLVRRGRRTVITGGAGFVGANLADRLAGEGRRVLIYDSLDRPGVEENMAWLCARHGDRVVVEIADVRDSYALRDAVGRAERVFHLAAQVAVTTSLDDPIRDFEVNARGTLNLLEALRAAPGGPPPLVFTSTNKVYGGLRGLSFVEMSDGYRPADPTVGARGIAEDQPLDFCSPYGCSKGAADQYVLDYARIYGLPATVFRMSCIYGPRQFGTEDQGWVAHFLLRALRGEPITVYGDGKQVRDVLFVDDLVDALLLAQERIADTAGRAFNIGGGPDNAVSLLGLLDLIARLNRRYPEVSFGPWRPGDQLCYVSDIWAFHAATGWRPRVGVEGGVARLWRWLHGATVPPAVSPVRAPEGAVA